MGNNQPPASTGFSIIGPVLRLWRDPLQFFVSLSKNGPISSYRIGISRVYLITEPSLVRELLVNHSDILSKEELARKGKRLIGEGMLTTWGERHRSQRQQLSSAFHRERIAEYGVTVSDRAREVNERWEAGREIDVEREMSRLALDIVLRTLFSVESPRIEQVVSDAIATIGDVHKLTALPMAGYLWWLPFDWAKRFRRGCQMLDEVAFSLVEERSRAEKRRRDLLDILVEPIGGGGSDKIKRYQLARDQIITFILAGYGTVATLLTWFWYVLSQHPSVEKNVHDEIDQVCRGESPATSHLPQFSYTQMILLEVLRLYPPVWVFGRVAERDFVLGGYRIRKKSRLLISPYVIHHHPKYFANPELFDPLRWKENGSDRNNRPGFIPFGIGPRSCIGERFARTEALMIITTLAQKWELRPVSQDPVEPRGGFTLTPKNPLLMRLRKRISDVTTE